MSCVLVLLLQRGYISDGCDLSSTLCRYDLRKGDLCDTGMLVWKQISD